MSKKQTTTTTDTDIPTSDGVSTATHVAVGVNIHKPYRLAISKEALAELPMVTYAGGITIVESEDMVRVALRELRRHKIVGFDTETRPSFHKGRLHKVALMQLSTREHCFLLRLNKLGGISEALKDFLEDTAVTKIGLSVHDDFSSLRRTRQDLEPQGFVEIQEYIKRFNITDISLQKVYAIVFEQRISKAQRLTNWESETLTDGQQAYAALDAWACLHLYDYLSGGYFDPSKSRYRIAETDDEQTPLSVAQ